RPRCLIASTTRGLPISQRRHGGATSGSLSAEQLRAWPPGRWPFRSSGGKGGAGRGAFLFYRGASNGLLQLVGEGVARAAHRAHRIGLGAAHHRLAQTADMHVDRPLVDIDVAAPYAVEQLRPAEDATWALHEKLEQAKFGRPEMHLAAIPRHAMRFTIELDIAGGEQLRCAL